MLTVTTKVPLEHLGLIPTFFAEAAIGAPGEPGDSLQGVADAMDKQYTFGGFEYPFEGVIDENGTYRAPDDPPLEPYAAMNCRGYLCYVYAYSIVAILSPETGEYKIGRFD